MSPESQMRDLEFYIHKISKIAPLSYSLKNKDFFNTIIPQYLSQIQINKSDLTENLFYLPIFLKQAQKNLSLETYYIELLDYEFSVHQVKSEPKFKPKKKKSNSLHSVLYVNPITQILQFEYDIHSYAQSKNSEVTPNKRPHILIVSKNTYDDLIFLEAKIHHAAIIDILQDGSRITKDIVQILQEKHPNIAQRDWIVALKELKDNHVIIEE
jgi:rRNA maturation protein Rpf1